MKKLTIISSLIMILFLFSFCSAYVCSDKNMQKNTEVPCEVITPSNMQCSDSAFVTSLSNMSNNYSASMNLKYSTTKTYNFSFNYTEIGDYWINLCDNSSAVFTIYPYNESNTNLLDLLINQTNQLNNATGGRDIYYTISTGFEYSQSETASFIATLENSSGYPINNQNVTLNVYYPNNTILFNQTLIQIGSSGTYYLNKIIPSNSPLGTYSAVFFTNKTLGSLSFKVIGTSSDSSYISFVSPSTSSGNYSQNFITANFTYFTTYPFNKTIVTLYNQTAVINQTNYTTFLNFTGLNNDTYYINASVIDSIGNVYNSETRVYTLDSSYPQFLSVSSNVTTNSATITWSTNKQANYSLLWGVNPLNFERTNQSYRLNHTLTLTSLLSNQMYFYNITACDSFNNCNHSITYNFTTDSEPSNTGGTWHPPFAITSNESFSVNNTLFDSVLKFLNIEYQSIDCPKLQKYKYFLGIENTETGCKVTGIKWWIIILLIFILGIIVFYITYQRIKNIESQNRSWAKKFS